MREDRVGREKSRSLRGGRGERGEMRGGGGSDLVRLDVAIYRRWARRENRWG